MKAKCLIALLLSTLKRAQGTGHRAQGMEHGAWIYLGRFRLRSGRQGDMGKWGQGEESLLAFPSLLGTEQRAQGMEHGFIWEDSVYVAADKETWGNGDKEKKAFMHFRPSWVQSKELRAWSMDLFEKIPST